MAKKTICYCQIDDSYTIETDDSGDENSNSVSDSIVEPPVQQNNSTECYLCNGYYGSTFGDPVCVTCHAFLFPDYASNGRYYDLTEKSDDGDSGNDEPADAYPAPEKADYVPTERPVPVQAPDSLATRLELLSVLSEPDRHASANNNIDILPTEVVLAIFSYLDDFSLFNVANVCRRWRTLIMYEVPGRKWQELTMRRFPLFKPLLSVTDWFHVYTTLMRNCSCTVCLRQMAAKIRPPGEETSWRRNRLRSELKILRNDPHDGIQALPLDPPICSHWQATIQGPAGSPYEGGIFFLYLQIPYSYPMCPPVVRFLTKVFHPNISRHGDVGIDSIHYNWSLALTLSKVLISVQSLLTDPYCQVCMEPEIGQLYLTDRQKFESIARRWTWRYAMTDLIPN